MNREHWLAERKTGIGSSDAAPICGLSPWSTPAGVYFDKTGQLPEQPQTAAMRWGLLLEPALTLAYEEATGAQLEVPAGVVRHPKYAWMLCTPDRIQAGSRRPVELKTCNPFAGEHWGQPGTDEIPEHYLVQVQHQLAVLEAEAADVAVLIGGSDFRVYHVPRSEKAIGQLIDIEAAFWERVEKRQPPDPEWAHPRTLDLLKSLFGVTDETICLGDDMIGVVERYEDLRSIAKAHEKEADEYKARLLFAMGEASRALLPDGRMLNRKTIHRSGYSVAATDYVQFSIKAPKGLKKEVTA